MLLSRRLRKKKEAGMLFRQIKLGMFWGLLFIIAACFSKNILAFTILTVIIFFGMLALNPYNMKRFIPGLNAQSIGFKIFFVFIYLILVMALISKVCME